MLPVLQRRGFLFCMFVARQFVNSQVCENGIAIKPFDVKNVLMALAIG